MKLAQRVFDFYLDASIHVAFAVFALVNVTGLTLNIPVDAHLSWFLFFGTVTCYNFVKYGVELEKYILVANRYHRNIQFASFIAFGLAGYHSIFLKIDVWICIVCLLVLTGLYAVPVLPHSKKLRSWGGLKVFVVALVWAGATVILPAISQGGPNFWDICIETVQRFLFVLILMVPFEIRDLVYDSPELKTLPQRYGVARTKTLGAFATLPFFFSVFLKDSVSTADVISTGVLFLVLGALMFVTKRNQSSYFASFWVEAIPIVWCILLLALQRLF